jgi:hypothetical protein
VSARATLGILRSQILKEHSLETFSAQFAATLADLKLEISVHTLPIRYTRGPRKGLRFL